MRTESNYKSTLRRRHAILGDKLLWVSKMNKYPLLRYTQPLVWYRVHEGNSANQHTGSSKYRLGGLKLFFKDSLSSSSKTKCWVVVTFLLLSIINQKLKFLSVDKGTCYYASTSTDKKAKFFMMLILVPFFSTLWNKTSK